MTRDTWNDGPESMPDEEVDATEQEIVEPDELPLATRVSDGHAEDLSRAQAGPDEDAAVDNHDV